MNTGPPPNATPKRFQRSDLPFGSEFSPSQIDLVALLELAKHHGGDWRAFEAAVKLKYFGRKPISEYNKRKLANNAKLAMIAYGLIDRDARLTALGERLYQLRSNPDALHREFARHILLHLHGMNLVQCVRDMTAAGEQINLVNLRAWLDQRGIHFPRGGKHPSVMRLWLAKAGVFTHGWQVNDARVKDLTGVDSAGFDALASLTREQRFYLKALANMGGPGPYRSNDVEKLATATYGVKFNEKNLPKQVLYPLEQAGYIHLKSGTREPGRGAKPFLVSPTAKLVREVIEPLLEQLEKQTDPELHRLLRTPLAEILRGLGAPDKHTRGLALEALAFHLMRLLDMSYVATRLRGTATGGAEVDLVFESSRLVFSRWQVQCKNTKTVALDDVAKEVGLSHMLKSNVIVVIGTGKIGPAAREFASKVMTDSNLCIVLLDGADVRSIQRNPPAIVDAFNREAAQAMKLKALQLKE